MPAVPESPKPRRSPIYALQVQAFLEAAEEIEIDEDTFEDLVDGLDDDEPAPHGGEVRPESDDALELDENDGYDDPEYNTLVEECEPPRWFKNYLS